jgi:DNA-binding transcriptional LysR family regulator
MHHPRLEQLRVKQLRFLSLLETHGSLSATAEQLSMTQSAASMMLKEIESLFDVKLFRRQGRGMALTEEGMALMPRWQTVLGEVGAMGSTLQGAVKPTVRIGAFPHTAATVLPEIIKKLISGQTVWRPHIVDGRADYLLQMLLQGEIDILLGRLPSHVVDAPYFEDLSQRLLYEAPLSIVSSSKHPLASKKKLDFPELAKWQWILPDMQSTTRVGLMEAFLRRGINPPTPAVESPSFFYSLSVVAQTDLLTCCAQSAALQSSHATSILPLVVSQEPLHVSMVWRKSSVVAQRVAEFLL